MTMLKLYLWYESKNAWLWNKMQYLGSYGTGIPLGFWPHENPVTEAPCGILQFHPMAMGYCHIIHQNAT